MRIMLLPLGSGVGEALVWGKVTRGLGPERREECGLPGCGVGRPTDGETLEIDGSAVRISVALPLFGLKGPRNLQRDADRKFETCTGAGGSRHGYGA